MPPTIVRPTSTTLDGVCHTLVRRLPADTDLDVLRGNLASAGRLCPELAGLAIATEPVAAPAGEGDGLARLCVLARPDGGVELLVTARRDRLGRLGLAALAATVLGAPPGTTAPAESWPVPGPVDWNLGERGRRSEPLSVPVPVDPEVVVDATRAALAARDAVAAALAHYRLADSSVFAVFADDSVECAGTSNPADDEDASALGSHADVVVPAPPGARPVVGVFVVDATVDRYVPFTAPPFPVTVTVEVGPEGRIEARLCTDESVLARGTAEQFALVLGSLLGAYARGDRDRALDEVAQLPAPQVAAVVAVGGTPARPGFVPTSIPAGFTAVALAQPDSAAVSDGHTTLTYRELAERSRRIAAGLRERGVVPGDRVAVSLERDATAVATMLGVMSAGAAYVPVDPAYPAERLAYTAADAGVRLVVTDDAGRAAFPDRATVTTAELLTAASTHDSPFAVDPASIAYVIYTSGSTGRPKGVAVPHANVAALVDATRDELSLGPADVWSFVHSSAFDFSVWEIWGCLLTGGHLVVVSAEAALWPEDFIELLAARGVTVLSQTPAAFAALDEADARMRPALALRLVVFGGESLDVRMLRGWLDRHPAGRCRLVNMFGITETTVHVTAQTVAGADAVDRSVGRALPGWSVSVRDRRGAVLPFGAAGEIWVGGAGVADHYLNQPELTRARFVQDPVTGIRQYRSGDLGRLHPDGRLDHLGRIDSQVKLRGFRIELGEIRAVLLDDPGVRAAAVVVHQSVPGDSATSRLAAYVVLDGLRSTEEIRRRTASFLPHHMVPATVTALPTLPLTVNGKVDTARLQALA
ncbi:amino acid adenylation domain-containing protein [Streptacidiphilus sp. MAP12-33]|uniref:amino acid adenylation domain-containing protein n=1 Tax=Streptacidiphilus sp. MAP12-33 TaxID=3156266 RepID=UPI0035176F82